MAWGRAALLVQGQEDLIASGLNFSDYHGKGGTGKSGGLWSILC